AVRGRRRRWSRQIDARRVGRARSAVVLRRILRDRGPARVNAMACVMPAVENRADPIEAIAAFTAGFSLEATRPTADDVAALAGIVPARTSGYVTAVPRGPAREGSGTAARPRRGRVAAGPHLCPRRLARRR